MSRLFKAGVVILVLATSIQVMVIAYIFGFERGFISGELMLGDLYVDLHPEVQTDFSMSLQPLWNILFGTSSILALCWTLTVALILRGERLKNKGAS